MDVPILTPSIHIAFFDLKLDRLVEVYPGNHPFVLADLLEGIPLLNRFARDGISQAY